MIGERKYSIPLLIHFRDASIDVHEYGIVINADRRIVVSPGSTVSVRYVRQLPLDKHRLCLSVTDQSGRRDEFDVVISERYLPHLKAIVPTFSLPPLFSFHKIRTQK